MRGRSDDRRLTRLFQGVRGEAAILREQLLGSGMLHPQLVRLLDVPQGVAVQQFAAATLEAASELVDADALLVVVRAGREQAVVSRGLSPLDEQRLCSVAGSVRGGSVKPIALPPLDDVGAEGGRKFESGGVVRVRVAGAGGVLAALWRGRVPPRSEPLEAVAELAFAVGVAVSAGRALAVARDMAARDPLTGLYNRNIFHDDLARAVSAARRYGDSVALCVLDVDDFKRVNTELGHLEGDALLVEVARCVESSVRAADVAGRIGGDEFAVLLPHSTVRDAGLLYTRIGEAVTEATRSCPLAITLSAGIGDLVGDEDAEALFRRTEYAMRMAKATGKGHSVAAG